MAKTKVVKLNESKALSSVAVSQLSWKNRKKTSGRRRRRGITTLKALAAPPPCYVNICTMLLDAGSYLNRFFSKIPSSLKSSALDPWYHIINMVV